MICIVEVANHIVTCNTYYHDINSGARNAFRFHVASKPCGGEGLVHLLCPAAYKVEIVTGLESFQTPTSCNVKSRFWELVANLIFALKLVMGPQSLTWPLPWRAHLVLVELPPPFVLLLHSIVSCYLSHTWPATRWESRPHPPIELHFIDSSLFELVKLWVSKCSKSKSLEDSKPEHSDCITLRFSLYSTEDSKHCDLFLKSNIHDDFTQSMWAWWQPPLHWHLHYNAPWSTVQWPSDSPFHDMTDPTVN